VGPKKPKSIEARSLVAGRNLEPYIQIVQTYDDGTEEQLTQWTPEEAYHHVMCVLGAVEAANTDAFLVAFLTDQSKIGMPLEQIGPVLQDFRAWRERRRPPEKAM
jgi:hypothetical protein